MVNIIIRGKSTIGKTRSEQEENLRREWGRTMTDEQLDKMKFVEKVAKRDTGSEENFFRTNITDFVE